MNHFQQGMLRMDVVPVEAYEVVSKGQDDEAEANQQLTDAGLTVPKWVVAKRQRYVAPLPLPDRSAGMSGGPEWTAEQKAKFVGDMCTRIARVFGSAA